MDRIHNNYLFKNHSLHRHSSLFASNSTHIAPTHCRTRALGASYYCCKLNHAEIEQLHSCRHRSCYVCVHKQRLDWIEKQKARLLDVPHFHVIFTLLPTMSNFEFWPMYRSVYKKHWCVRIEERYAHGKGVVLYLARYCKGGPVDPRQLKQITADVVKMSYLDHRDQRIKQQRLKPMDFITRLLQHVPPKGLHTIRYYGLYASASKLRYQRCRQQCGTIEYMPHASSVDRLSMVVYCKTCGGPALLNRRWWSRRSKGISINKEALNICVSGSVQQVDEPLLAGGFYNMS